MGGILIRRMLEIGLPPNVECADGGTAGMDVAFRMRGADKVVIVDACKTGAAAGTMYQVPGAELENLPPLTGMNLHAFRWDHALAFGRWLLKDEYPNDITVYLIEAETFEFGADLSPIVRAAMEKLIARLFESFINGTPAVLN